MGVDPSGPAIIPVVIEAFEDLEFEIVETDYSMRKTLLGKGYRNIKVN